VTLWSVRIRWIWG